MTTTTEDETGSGPSTAKSRADESWKGDHMRKLASAIVHGFANMYWCDACKAWCSVDAPCKHYR